MDDFSATPPRELDPYTTLDLNPTASAAEVKTAYRKLALRHHPDKASPAAKETAHKTFQNVAFAYAILSDERRRRRYDATGNTCESLDIEEDDFNWTDFFRAQWNDTVTTTSIGGFKRQYQGSEEERIDILNTYRKTKGNMNKLFAEVMMSNPIDDEDRFKTLIDDNIKAGTVEAYDNYLRETASSKKKRRQRAEREAKEAEEHLQDLKNEGKGRKSPKKENEKGMGDLAALIQQRQQGRAKNFLDDLEAKYAAPKSKVGKNGGTKRRKEGEPLEEAFRKTAVRQAKRQKLEVKDDAAIEDNDGGEEEDVDLEEESAFSEEDDDRKGLKPAKGKRKYPTKSTTRERVSTRRTE